MHTAIIFIIAIVCLAAGIAIGYLAAAQRSHTVEADRRIAVSQLDEARKTHNHRIEEQRLSFETRIEDLRSTADHRIEDQRRAFEARIEEIRTQHAAQLDDLRTQHAAQLAQQTALLQQQLKTATEQLRTTAQDVLRSRSEELQQTNAQQMAHIIEPLRTSLANIQQQTARQEEAHAERLARLDETIKTTLQQTACVSQSAERLATALTAENKTQGNFGELQLKTLLDNMGLREGLQYDTQVTLRADDGTTLLDPDNGQRLQPDFIVHFPEGRDLIIDSKMSLTAFTAYFEATDDDTRAEAIRRHVQSVRSHVDELAAKKYHRYITGSHQTVDFVVMYLYSDSALQLALSADPQLWDYAAHKGVLITGSHNLYMLLRIVVMSWDRMRQSENQQRIIEEANRIVSRVQTFYARFLEVEAHLHKTQQAFDALKTTTADRGQSIVTSARNLIRLGAKEDHGKSKKALPKPEEEDDDTAANNA